MEDGSRSAEQPMRGSSTAPFAKCGRVEPGTEKGATIEVFQDLLVNHELLEVLTALLRQLSWPATVCPLHWMCTKFIALPKIPRPKALDDSAACRHSSLP